MQIISMSISEETGITYDLFDTNKEYPIECMLVMEEDAPRVWQPMTFGTIKGFTYEKGHSYELKVKRTRLANPPMDASAYTYELVQILEDRIITEPDEPTDTDKEIHSEADIEYQELCPYEKYAINPEEIRIDKAGNLFDANGSALLPYEDKRIYLENILDKADANWNLFNKIPYMAYYAYVFSPLTDEIRLVRVSGGGPMLKNVIPADEYQVSAGSFLLSYYSGYSQKLGNTLTLSRLPAAHSADEYVIHRGQSLLERHYLAARHQGRKQAVGISPLIDFHGQMQPVGLALR